MARAFTVAALAIAEGGANAVGAVRFSCAEAELEIELVRVAGYAEGFALGAVAAPVCFRVPYTAVRALFRRGRALCLALDPAACAPYNRFALARFEGDAPGAPGVTPAPAIEAMTRAHRARLQAHLASLLLPGPLGLFVALSSPADLASGPLGTASLGLLAALGAWLALRWAARAATWGGPPSDRLRDGLEAELSRRMGFAPERLADGTDGRSRALPPSGDAAAPALLVRAPALAPRSVADALESLPLGARVLVPLALAVVGIVGNMAFVQRFSTPLAAPSAAPEVMRIGGAVRALDTARLVRALRELAEPTLPRCLCQRADSPLWKDGMPVLSLLGSSGPDDGSGVIAPALEEERQEGADEAEQGEAGGAPPEPAPPRGHYEIDLAVVNNSASPLHDVRVVLTFARRDRHGERVGITERGLFWEGALGPGRAVKWHVDAPGTEVKIEPSVPGLLEGEIVPAPADVFVGLTRARYRVVRIHAATMLAYLRDPRVHEALLSLGPGASAEELTFARIRRAAADAIPCAIVAEQGRLRACLFNGSSKPIRGATLREIPERAGAAARSWPVGATLPVHDGVVVTVPLDPTLPLDPAVPRDARSGGAPPIELAIDPREDAAAR